MTFWFLQLLIFGTIFQFTQMLFFLLKLYACVLFQVLSATSMPSMYDRLKDSNDLLDQINKGLNAYLEKKRLFFSRWGHLI